jgi:hypothetical protein
VPGLVIDDDVVGVVVLVPDDADVVIGGPVCADHGLDVPRLSEIGADRPRRDADVVLRVDEQIVIVDLSVEEIPVTVHQVEAEGGGFEHNSQGEDATATGDHPGVQQIDQGDGVGYCCMDVNVHPGGTG